MSSNKPNKTLYYGVLIGSFALSAFALYVAYAMVRSSYLRSIDANGPAPEYYVNDGNATDPSLADELDQEEPYKVDVAGWLNTILLNAYPDKNESIESEFDIRISEHFSRVGWLDFEAFEKQNREHNIQVVYGTMNNFEVDDLGTNKVSTHSWIVTLPIFRTKAGHEERRTLKIRIEQESFNGQKEDMKIMSWQTM